MEQNLLRPLKPTYTWETIELNVLHFYTANQNDKYIICGILFCNFIFCFSLKKKNHVPVPEQILLSSTEISILSLESKKEFACYWRKIQEF